MSKPLSQMSNEELWQLFPIFLTAHNPEWSSRYCEQAQRINKILCGDAARISHVGSTAVPSISAKPIVDILIEIPQGGSLESSKQKLLAAGFRCMYEESGRLGFNLGYGENGFEEKVFHLHLRFFGDNNELYFRDYLLEYPEAAAEYEKLKLSLWKKHEHNRDAYTAAKTDFVTIHTAAAKQRYGGRYAVLPNNGFPQTQRLELAALNAEQLGLWVNNLAALEKELNCTYRAEPMQGIFLEIVKGQLAATLADESNYPWHSFWFLIRKSDRAVIGSADFKNGPDKNGEVEIGYGIGKEFERCGYMTEAVKAMCAWAQLQPSVRHVVAETEVDGVASQRILKRCGFTQTSCGETAWWRL